MLRQGVIKKTKRSTLEFRCGDTSPRRKIAANPPRLPVKIFLSYGHDRNTPLIERIGADLRVAGHEVWVDTSEIKRGDDWRRSIIHGLLDTDWTLAFLSKHSTREPGVCLDELAIGLHVKGGTIATVLVEAEQEVSPPVSIGHIQWLDMHDWETRQRADPVAFEAWYQQKLAEILRLLASPVTAQFAGEIAELDRHLQPIAQEADIGPLVEGFVGRLWLLEKLEAWRRGEARSRLFWLTGAPGTGKSAFAAWIAHYGRATLSRSIFAGTTATIGATPFGFCARLHFRLRSASPTTVACC